MSTEVVMPQMGADMEEGTLLRWLKHPGDPVSRGEAIAEIETDKANVELESFEEGVLEQVLVAEGDVVPVGRPVALIGSGAAAGAAREASPAPAADRGQAAQAESGREAPQPATTAPQVAVAPPESPADAASPLQAAAKSEHIQGAVQGMDTGTAPNRPPDGATVPGAGTGAGPTTPATVPPPSTADSQESRATSATSLKPAGAPESGERRRISPLARSVAARLGIDAASLQGSGPDGRVVRRDVEAAVSGGPVAAAKPEPPAAPSAAVSEPVATEPPAQPAAQQQPAQRPQQRAGGSAGGLHELSRMRRAIARRMAQSKREAPHYYVTVAIDMTDAMSMRRMLNQQSGEGGAHVTVNDMVVKAAAEALRRFPMFNAAFENDALRFYDRINICIAVALPDGLMAPALLDLETKSLGAIAREAKDLGERTRRGALRGPELNEGTFTISNLGMYGIETLIPIITPGQAAVLGVGAVLEQPAVHDGQVVVRQLMRLALAADHRVTDGAQGAEFLRELKNLLEEPVRLAL